MREVWHAYRLSLAAVFVGGMLSGVVIAALRILLPKWTMLNIMSYSPPMLIIEGLVVLHVGFWLRPLTKGHWIVNGFLLGLVSQVAALFPYDIHTLLPYHWSALLTLPAAMLGMALVERG